ncbi:uncharacterized protein LOC118080222 [Zootoca vivipara]|uniref:uncharacterized protein LOC118080222 n=1 Tax=Zootoca vivipara TaxID=8524 RepID=UPI00293B9405|nr:uncharacterized protein LOC118080222 [Zootoca vivipara]
MAAAGGHMQCLRDEATCSICLDYFKDPVTIPECGHNFCRSCLIECWGESEAEASCPQCRERVQRRGLIPNRQLANFVEIAQNLSLQEEGGKGRVCKEHQEPLKLFCKVHEAPICLVCDRSKEHENHKVIPLEEALEEYKREICHHLEILRKEREEILAYQANLDKESKDLLKLTEKERLKTVEKFKELRQFLEEQEKCLLNHVEEVEKEIAGRRDEQLAKLSRNLSSLERIIQEMEEKGQQPASELLQDVRRTFQRYEKRESPEKQLPFSSELKNRILESCDLNHLVEDTMKQWKDALLYRKSIQKDVQSFRNLQRANVTLDPDTAHPWLILSEDRKSVRYRDEKQDLPNNPERFSNWPCVLGREGFTAGRHFWEVNVESGEWWEVGVARKSVERKGIICICPEEGFWAVWKRGDEFRVRTSPDFSLLSLKPRRIRVTLDYEGGRVSFSDADSGAELYTFSGASFSGETLLPFFCLWGNKTPLSIFISGKGNSQWLKTGKAELNSAVWGEEVMAASGGYIQCLRDEATCSICQDYFKDPMISPECGHNFCRSCLIECSGESEAEASCPHCRKTVQRRSLIPSGKLAKFVEIAKNLSVQEGKEEERKGGVCEEHQEPLKLFCKVHEDPICEECKKSKEHENHKVIPLEEASEEYKGEICRRLEILRKEREEILAYQEVLDKESKELLKLTEMERLKTVEKFRQLRQFLEEQEKCLLNHVEEVEKVIVGRRDAQLARLSRKLSSLESIIQEMEEKGQQPASELLQIGQIKAVRNPNWLIQPSLPRTLASLPRTLACARQTDIQGPGFSSILRGSSGVFGVWPVVCSEFPSLFPSRIIEPGCYRYEKRESPEKPLPFPSELRNEVLESCDLNHLVEDAMKQLKDALLDRKSIQKANVTLDPDTAHPRLILSKDRKSVRLRDKEQNLPQNPERFSIMPCVLGHEEFSAGRHFWEINVERGDVWAVGVARKSVGRKGSFFLNPQGGVWAVRKLGDEYFACTSPDFSLLSLKPRRIRVTLDYEGRRVSFSDADSEAELYTFSGASFSGETLFPFFYLPGNKTHLKIS